MTDCIQQKSQISEHTSKACIFCKIVKGEIPSSKVYEDDALLAFLDIAPIHKGHTLVIPKEHYETIIDVPDELLGKVLSVVKKVGSAVIKAVNTDGFNVLQSNGKTAGQEVPHLHFHVLPRFKDDGFKFWPQGKYEEGEIEQYIQKIANLLK